MILYDYSNMVFFFCGFYFLIKYADEHKANHLLFSAFLFGLATYIRTETLILVVFIAPLVMLYLYKAKERMNGGAIKLGAFILFPAIFYFLCIHVFVRL